MISARKYKDRNPKYIELYSRNPPSIAPSKFEESATATEVDLFSSVEKANPEKNKGSVSTPVMIIRFNHGVTILRSMKVRPNPVINAIKSIPYVVKGGGFPFFMTSRLAKNAIMRIEAITMLVTIHVLPYTRASSVIPLVSTSIKPAPKKKQGIEKLLPELERS